MYVQAGAAAMGGKGPVHHMKITSLTTQKGAWVPGQAVPSF